MPLPLLRRTTEDDARFVLTSKVRLSAAGREGPRRGADLLDRRSWESDGGYDPRTPAAMNAHMPARLPQAGEQYRFHVDMGLCIGCKCCVVACNEQNGNPASINWRRVGEIEGGFFPAASRSYLSMGCNHCVDPTCLSGCPVDAYSKDAVTGIVLHSAEACIGCQYCTWNCSYGVPQYNAERGVVGKCDMCYGRLEHGQSPACVAACPEGAIAIELVNIADWRAAAATAAPGRGLPSFDGSLSTTRVTMPAHLPPNGRPVDLSHVTPEHAHWSLVFMTVLTQLSVGTFVVIWLLQLIGGATRLGTAAATSLVVAALALGGATLHLGRPAYAYRALKMWRRSWLSREVALFGAFSVVAAVYAVVLFALEPGAEAVAKAGGPHVPMWEYWRSWGPALQSWGPAFQSWGPALQSWGPAFQSWRPALQSWGPALAGPAAALGGLSALLGIAGVTASACIYRVPSRPAWNTRFTLLQFNFTGAALGPLLVLAVGASDARGLAFAAATMAGAQLLLIALRFVRLVATDSIELKGTARLLSTSLKPLFLARALLLGAGGVALPLVMSGSVLPWIAFALALAGEIIGRYLFFVSVVPKHMATPYLELGSEAA
jgi:formate dehydrogenase iron-sulfur subunit